MLIFDLKLKFPRRLDSSISFQGITSCLSLNILESLQKRLQKYCKVIVSRSDERWLGKVGISPTSRPAVYRKRVHIKSSTPFVRTLVELFSFKFHFISRVYLHLPSQIRLRPSCNENTPHLGNPAPNGTDQVLCMRCDSTLAKPEV